MFVAIIKCAWGEFSLEYFLASGILPKLISHLRFPPELYRFRTLNIHSMVTCSSAQFFSLRIYITDSKQKTNSFLAHSYRIFKFKPLNAWH